MILRETELKYLLWTHGAALALTVLTMIGLLGSGCAGIVKGQREEVRIESVPPGAAVFIDGEAKGAAPVVVQLAHGDDYRVRVVQADGQARELVITSSFSGWTLLGGVGSLVFDGLWGTVRTVDEDHVVVDFRGPPAPKAMGAP